MTVATRELTNAPRMLPLYARALATLLPGSERLPALPGGGGAVPDLALELRDVPVDLAELAEYRDVCGFRPGPALPLTYPHVLAFPLQMALMADGSFPFAPMGLVHVANEISQGLPLRPADALDLRVHATQPLPHPRGATFEIVTRASIEGETVWQERSTMLSRSQANGAEPGRPALSAAAPADPDRPLLRSERWSVPGDTGRRYAAVSGDRNPIHLNAWAARLFGFPRAIAHGMWSKARCLAALEQRLTPELTVAVAFRRPLLLPGAVCFRASEQRDDIVFALEGEDGTPHLAGVVEPVSWSSP
jgi:acyl dehydratase